MEDIKVFAIDGGPCGGKTTALKEASEKLRDYGYHAFVVPEVATELFMHGITIGDQGMLELEFQRQALLTQLEREERYKEFAKHHRAAKKVILCDRGAVSGRPYLPPGQWEALIKNMGFGGIAQLRDARYHGVFHLVTAADGAEEFYTLENNGARTESPEKARALDKGTQQAWSGHPHFRLVDNSTDFEKKKHRLLELICHALGLPVPLEIERKYLLRAIPDMADFFAKLEIPPVKISITQAYLVSKNSGVVRRIRKREQDGYAVCYYEEKRAIKPGVRIETGSVISPAEYQNMRGELDPCVSEIIKDRYCFIWKSQYFELDVFKEPLHIGGLTVLEIELTREHDAVDLPPFLDIAADVTTDERFTNFVLARNI